MLKRVQLDSKGLLTAVKSAVRMAEVLFPGAGLGGDKREWVITFINERVDLPVLGERAEAVLIGALVDLAVALFNGAIEGWDP